MQLILVVHIFTNCISYTGMQRKCQDIYLRMYTAFWKVFDLFQKYQATNFPAEKGWHAPEEVHICPWNTPNISCKAAMYTWANIKQYTELK